MKPGAHSHRVVTSGDGPMLITLRKGIALATILCAGATLSCAEQQITGLKVPTGVAKNTGVAFSQFFVAWSNLGYRSTPMQTQVGLDSLQYRQEANWDADIGVQNFAAANPGKLYIVGDEPDQQCVTPYDYAGILHNFVVVI